MIWKNGYSIPRKKVNLNKNKGVNHKNILNQFLD